MSEVTKISHRVRLDRKALILTFAHPYGATEMMAQSFAHALSLNGYQPVIGIMGAPDFDSKLRTLFDPDLDIVFNLGSLTLNLEGNNRPVWEIVAPHVRFISVIVDAIPYDLRIPGFAKFVENYRNIPNGHIVCYEKNIADIMQAYTGKKTFYMPTGANLMPRRREEKKYPGRLMFWGSIESELGRTDQTGDMIEVLKRNNVWGYDERRLNKLAEELMFNEHGYGLHALARATDMPVEEMLRNRWIQNLCEIDSAMKRFRRFFLLDTLRSVPLDIYGKNWDHYVRDWPDVRIVQTTPDHNLAFGEVCQEYAGVINVDPNWGWGTNERAITALTLGVNVMTSNNRRVDGIDWCFQYGFSKQSIFAAANALVDSKTGGHVLADTTWEYLLANLLQELESA